MLFHNDKETLTARFYDRDFTRKRSFYWLTPAFILFLYILVLGSFAWQNKIYNDSLYFASPDKPDDLHRLLIFLGALSVVIILSLLALWYLAYRQMKTEASLKAETLFRRAMENSMSTGIRVIDLQGRIVYVNPAFCQLTGWSEVDLIGKGRPYPYWIPERYPQHNQYLDDVLEGKVTNSTVEIEAQRRNGERFTCQIYVAPLHDPKGHQIGWISSITDITQEKRILADLDAAHVRFMTVLESLDDAIAVITSHNPSHTPELLFANRNYQELLNNKADIFTNLQRQRHLNKTITPDIYMKHLNRWFEVSIQPITWTDSRQAMLYVVRDISERRKHEEESLLQQEKIQITSRLTTMGEMASSLAHELNQPMSAIVNYNRAAITFLKQPQVDTEKLATVLEKTANQAHRAGRIISRIREFVKRSEPHRKPVDIHEIISNTLELAQINAKKFNIQLKTDVPLQLPLVLADQIMVEQVLLNLVKNGIEAMADKTGESIVIQVKHLGKLIQVAVIDQGCGVKDPEQLFEPFFSTKKEGLGMGLNICRTIIESHHGNLWVKNNSNSGATFFFTLQCVETEKHLKG